MSTYMQGALKSGDGFSEVGGAFGTAGSARVTLLYTGGVA